MDPANLSKLEQCLPAAMNTIAVAETVLPCADRTIELLVMMNNHTVELRNGPGFAEGHDWSEEAIAALGEETRYFIKDFREQLGSMKQTIQHLIDNWQRYQASIEETCGSMDLHRIKEQAIRARLRRAAQGIEIGD